jgi:hypothetical protein
MTVCIGVVALGFLQKSHTREASEELLKGILGTYFHEGFEPISIGVYFS